MKPVKLIFSLLIVVLPGLQLATAQTRADKKAAKLAAISNMINTRNYVFNADYVIPFRGEGSRSLTSTYDVTVSKDSIITYLPYFGRAYLADYNSTDGGIKSTLVNFKYNETINKNGNHVIMITPKDASLSDPKAIQSMRLDISPDGYASLQVISLNRDPISFDGTIEARSKPKNN